MNKEKLLLVNREKLAKDILKANVIGSDIKSYVLGGAQRKGWTLLKEMKDNGTLPQDDTVLSLKIVIGERPQYVVNCMIRYSLWLGSDPNQQEIFYNYMKCAAENDDYDPKLFCNLAVLGGKYLYPSLNIKIVYRVNNKKMQDAIFLKRKINFSYENDKLDSTSELEEGLQNEVIKLLGKVAENTKNKDLSHYEICNEIRRDGMGNRKSWESIGFELKGIKNVNDEL